MRTIKEKIKESGLKATPQRIAIYSVMQDLGHASADMLVARIQDVFPSITVATIYNVLESFVEAGLLQRRSSTNNKMYFDVNTYSHAHLFDEQGNVYMDFNDEVLMDMVYEYVKDKLPEGFDLKNIDIQFVGVRNA